MSAEAVSIFTVQLATSGRNLEAYMDEDARADYVYSYPGFPGAFTSDEQALLNDGDVTALFDYLAAHLPKPAGDDEDPAGPGG